MSARRHPDTSTVSWHRITYRMNSMLNHSRRFVLLQAIGKVDANSIEGKQKYWQRAKSHENSETSLLVRLGIQPPTRRWIRQVLRWRVGKDMTGGVTMTCTFSIGSTLLKVCRGRCPLLTGYFELSKDATSGERSDSFLVLLKFLRSSVFVKFVLPLSDT